MPAYQWILFDADNTLFDFDQAERSALVAAFPPFGYAYQEEFGQLYHRINAEIWIEFEQGRITATALRTERFQRLFEAASLPIDAVAFSAVYLVELGRSSQLIPGAESLVNALLRAGLRLALVTNGLKDVQRPRLASSPIAQCFEQVIISEEIGAQKPEAAFFEIAFERMGSPAKKSTLLVGDGLSADIQGGIAFGLDTCWYNPRRKPLDVRWLPTFQVNTLEEILPLVLNGPDNSVHPAGLG